MKTLLVLGIVAIVCCVDGRPDSTSRDSNDKTEQGRLVAILRELVKVASDKSTENVEQKTNNGRNLKAKKFVAARDWATKESTAVCTIGSLALVSEPIRGFGISESEYKNNMYCGWKIMVEPGKRILLHFTKFDVQPTLGGSISDSVDVYNGANLSAPLLGQYYGKHLPSDITSAGNTLTIMFHSDYAVTRTGFTVVYEVLDLPTCVVEPPAELSGPEGEVVVSKWQYTNDMNCRWKITVGNGKRVHLHFTTFDLEPEEHCKYDSVIVYNSDGTLLSTVCGSQLPDDITSTGTTLLVTFQSDGSITRDGFSIEYSAKTVNSDSETCGVRPILPSFLRIIGGSPVTPHSWPWQVWLVMIRGKRKSLCGGSIIFKRWIITAAHCVHGYYASQVVMGVGSHNYSEIRQKYKTLKDQFDEIYEHSGYDPKTVVNDIALLKLKDDISFNREVSPVCLPKTVASIGKICVATGWGETMGRGDRSVLNQVLLPILDNDMCNLPEWYNNQINAGRLCAGYENPGQGGCNGDSGGPLVCMSRSGAYELQGITSFGWTGCLSMKKPTVYTRVTHYLDWIEQTISENGGS